MIATFQKSSVTPARSRAARTPSCAPTLTPHAAAVERELGVQQPVVADAKADRATNEKAVRDGAKLLAKTSIGDILVFFAVLMVGFAYVWSRGDLDWVRAVADERAQPAGFAPRAVEGSESVLAG